MLSKSLIQFSVDGWGCVPSLLFTWGQTMVEVMKIMATSFKRSMQAPLHSVSPTLKQAITAPCLCQRLLDTPGQVWVSLLWGHCSFLLGPGAHKVLFVPSKSLFHQSCVSSGGSMVGIMVTSLKRSNACTQCPKLCSRPPPTHASAGDSWTFMGKSGSVSCGVTAPFSWVLQDPSGS